MRVSHSFFVFTAFGGVSGRFSEACQVNVFHGVSAKFKRALQTFRWNSRCFRELQRGFRGNFRFSRGFQICFKAI